MHGLTHTGREINAGRKEEGIDWNERKNILETYACGTDAYDEK